MNYLRGAAIGIACAIALGVAAVLILVWSGYAPMAADRAPSALEADLAMRAVHATSERAMGNVIDPLPVTAAHLDAGLTLYRANCIVCHGAADGKASRIAAGLYVPSPQFATDGAEDDPEGATYWKIAHGIRFSGMPSFYRSLHENEIWELSMFLRNMDALPRAIDKRWKTTPSAGDRDGVSMHAH